MGCGSSVHMADPLQTLSAGGSMIIPAGGNGTPFDISSLPDATEDMVASKGGSYIIGRKYAGEWEPGEAIARPENTNRTLYSYVDVPGVGDQVLRISYGCVSEQGRNARPPHKPNQDSFLALPKLGNNSTMALFGVFDGHGPHGEDASNYCRINIPDVVTRQPYFRSNPEEAVAKSFEIVHRKFISPQSQADSTVSGTTAVVVFFNGLNFVCANLGDSRAMIARGRLPEGPPYTASSAAGLITKALSNDHKPSRPDEKARIQKTAAKIMSEAALGISGGDPSKLYVCRVHEGAIRYGILFTRSIGDADAHLNLGLTSTPEMQRGRLDPENDRFIVIASDGVWDYMSEDVVANVIMKATGGDPTRASAAADAVAQAAVQRWDTASDKRRDDITVIVLMFSAMTREAASDEQRLREEEEDGTSSSAQKDTSSTAVVSETPPVGVTPLSGEGALMLPQASLREADSSLDELNSSTTPAV